MWKYYMFAVSSFSFALCLSGFSADSLPYLKTGEGYNVSQFDNIRFPDADLSSKSPLTNNQRVFTAFNGKSYATIENHGVNNAVLSINGNRIELKPYFTETRFTLDISEFVRIGTNALAVEEIEADDNSFMNVYIPYPELETGTPESVGMNPFYIQKANEIIEKDVDGGKGLPGAVLLVIKDGRIVNYTAYGYVNEYDSKGNKLPENEWTKISKNTLFDMASLTKMYATNFSLMHLVYTGKLDMQKPLKDYISDYRYPDITCQEIAEHSAGYAPEVLFYEKDGGGAGEEFYSQNREKTISLIEKNVPQVYTPGTKNIYSDTDFMLMEDLIEKITKERLDEYVLNTFYKPLGLKRITFKPLEHGIALNDIAATALKGNIETPNEYADFPNRRTALIHGYPQDEKSFYSMDSISGHAGLFGSAYDIGVLAQTIINGGGYGDHKFFDRSVIDEFCKPTNSDDTFGIGWRRAGASQKLKWMFGPFASPSAIGHTGFTGQISVIDPEYNLVIVLLTNKTQTPQISKMSFEGNKYQTTSYGDVITQVYKAVLYTKQNE